ncbi:glycosyltransferase [Janthinobacterium sp. BJB1]|uniref:glycosyltransferase n=1 Tax=Janthinobacterium sp. GW458P TaxID=1981504 RepID=UPI000A326EA6|nr:glycosyltransferase [Janthinobacterium sp. GW458P]MBE3024632.1 glycosyltransferase [Janthinobacterium sp. GW458P]PJC99944.1 glycosyltransferase [Janthinobacterium sp. BJB1]
MVTGPRRVLMVAYHFPPLAGGSGILRTLAFARHLPECGWQPLVLSPRPFAYAQQDDAQLAQLGAQATVRRTLALDAGRHLAIAGRYPRCLALPDRWSSWWLSAVPAGLRMIRAYRPDAIWSTYPIATAHLIALTLQKLSGLPWIADQRDPMLDDSDPLAPYPPEARLHRMHAWIEQRIAARSAAIVCTTPGAIEAHRRRLAHLAGERLALIENGYDEDGFGAAGLDGPSGRRRRFLLLHSGVVYPSERDPQPLFEALARLRRDGELSAATFQLVLRATGHDAWLAGLLAKYGVADLVTLAPLQPHHAALQEMLAADGLLLLQAANCNAQIPAKLYEYLRCRRPVLALTDLAGDSAAKLRHCGIDTIGQLASSSDCARALLRFLELARQGRAPLASQAAIALQSRQARSNALADLLDQVSHRRTA